LKKEIITLKKVISCQQQSINKDNDENNNLNNKLLISKIEIVNLKNVISFQQQTINNTNDKNIQKEIFENKFTEKLSKLFTYTQIRVI